MHVYIYGIFGLRFWAVLWFPFTSFRAVSQSQKSQFLSLPFPFPFPYPPVCVDRAATCLLQGQASLQGRVPIIEGPRNETKSCRPRPTLKTISAPSAEVRAPSHKSLLKWPPYWQTNRRIDLQMASSAAGPSAHAPALLTGLRARLLFRKFPVRMSPRGVEVPCR